MKIIYGVNNRLTACEEKCPAKEAPHSLRFDMILDDATGTLQKENTATIGKDTIRNMVRIIEKQIYDHCIRSILTNSNEWGYPGLWTVALQDLCGLSASINQHHPEQKHDNAAPSDITNRIIDDSAAKHGVEANLIKAVIKAESNFDDNATSARGAMGLMQIIPETARELGVKNPYDPVENVMGGTQYLKMLLDRYGGDRNVALAAYNWGMGNVEGNPGKLPEETKTYIARVNKYLDQATT